MLSGLSIFSWMRKTTRTAGSLRPESHVTATRSRRVQRGRADRGREPEEAIGPTAHRLAGWEGTLVAQPH